MHTTQILTLVLAMSVAMNIALGAGMTAKKAGVSTAKAILTGAGAAGTAMMIFLAAVQAYR